jgi:hypothetical protein
MPTQTEMLGDEVIGGEEPLGAARGLIALHAPLPLTGGLVRVLRTVVEIPMLAMFDRLSKAVTHLGRVDLWGAVTRGGGSFSAGQRSCHG